MSNKSGTSIQVINVPSGRARLINQSVQFINTDGGGCLKLLVNRDNLFGNNQMELLGEGDSCLCYRFDSCPSLILKVPETKFLGLKGERLEFSGKKNAIFFRVVSNILWEPVLFIIAMLLITSCSPKIALFEISDESVCACDSVKISWETKHAKTIRLQVESPDGHLLIKTSSISQALNGEISGISICGDSEVTLQAIRKRKIIHLEKKIAARPRDSCRKLDPFDLALIRLEEQSLIQPRIYLKKNIPVYLSGLIPIENVPEDDPVRRALAFLDRFKQLFSLSDPTSELYLTRITSDSSDYHLFFGQRADSIPVYGAFLAVHLEGRNFVSFSGNYVEKLPTIFVPPRINRTEAIQAVRNQFFPDNLELIVDPKLIYFDRGLISDEPSDPKLAWQVNVYGHPLRDTFSGRWSNFVDVQTGEVLFKVNQTTQIAFSIKNGANRKFKDDCTKLENLKVWVNENGPTTEFPGNDSDARKAVEGVNQTYDFFKGLDWVSYDNEDSRINFTIHNSKSLQIAAIAVPGCNEIVFDDRMVALDVVGHEFTHLISFSTGALLSGGNETSSLNESYADVFGTLIDAPNWLLGEDSRVGTQRNLRNPPSKKLPTPCGTFRHPDHMDDFQDLDPDCDRSERYINLGIPNKVAFLLAEGGLHRGIEVNPIGRTKLARLYLEVLTNRLGTSSMFIHARNESLQAAADFMRKGLFDFSQADLCAVQNAFAAVGLGEDCGENEDIDADYIPDLADNCLLVRNTGQLDTDSDGIGNICDDDDDNDGVPDEEDNCPLILNPEQRDEDGDGIGIHCDDDDNDSVVNIQDNCGLTFNPDQSDLDGDQIGDACDGDIDGDGFANDEDNCPLNSNSGQTDDDGDRVGNSCDLCPGLDDLNFDSDGDGRGDSQIFDIDGDGVGDPCDPDDDNDGICDVVSRDQNGTILIPQPGTPGLLPSGCRPGPNGLDNCRRTPNAFQFDLNRNGKGFLCDSDESFSLSGELQSVLEGFIRFDHPGARIRLPFDPCLADGRGCPDYIPENFSTNLSIQVPVEMPVKVLDDQGLIHGRMIATPNSGKAKFALPQEAVFNLNKDQAPFKGRSYFLEIEAPEDLTPGEDFPILIEVKNKDER